MDATAFADVCRNYDGLSTTYFADIGEGDRSERPVERLHLGRSVGGWAFLLVSYRGEATPPAAPATWAEWMAVLQRADVCIRDEFEEIVPWPRFREIVEAREHPEGLRRYPVDGVVCCARGEGTWDYGLPERP